MPPTFFLFLGLVIYLFASGASIVIFGAMLLLQIQETFAKKAIVTVLVSYPCLVIAGFILTIIFLPLWLILGALVNVEIISEAWQGTVAVIWILFFGVTLLLSSLYLWFFSCQVIYKRIDGEPVEDFLAVDAIFQYVRPLLFKLKIARSYTADIYKEYY